MTIHKRMVNAMLESAVTVSHFPVKVAAIKLELVKATVF